MTFGPQPPTSPTQPIKQSPLLIQQLFGKPQQTTLDDDDDFNYKNRQDSLTKKDLHSNKTIAEIVEEKNRTQILNS